MATVKKQKAENEEKIWDNPKNPIEASDSRDKEQLQRLYNEAKGMGIFSEEKLYL